MDGLRKIPENVPNQNILKDAESIKEYIPSIHKSGYPFIFIFFLLTIIVSLFSDFLGWLGIILSLWCIYFFRDPQRVISKRENILVSPADGKGRDCSDWIG